LFIRKGKNILQKSPKKLANKRNNRYICLQEFLGEPDTVTKQRHGNITSSISLILNWLSRKLFAVYEYGGSAS
jgi:hypothetical protein